MQSSTYLGLSRPDFAFLEQRKSLSEEQVSRDKCRATDHEESEKVEQP